MSAYLPGTIARKMFHRDPCSQSPGTAWSNALWAKVCNSLTLRKFPLETMGFLLGTLGLWTFDVQGFISVAPWKALQWQLRQLSVSQLLISESLFREWLIRRCSVRQLLPPSTHSGHPPDLWPSRRRCLQTRLCSQCQEMLACTHAKPWHSSSQLVLSEPFVLF